jgi:hypothetical protein
MEGGIYSYKRGRLYLTRNTDIHAKMWFHVLSDAQPTALSGKDLEWRKSIKKGGEKGEKGGRKEERFTSGSMAGLQGRRNTWT